MKPLTARSRAAATLAAVAVVLSGCFSAQRGELAAGGDAEISTTSDINPTDPATLRDGGNLRLAMAEFPENFNTQHIDGNVADVHAITKATSPRAFVVAADGSTTLNTDYFTSVEQTGSNPQVVTYTLDPRAVWTDGTPITWEDIASLANARSGRDPAFAIAGTDGYDRVASVTRGVDDRQAVMTFAEPFSDWKGMLAGNNVLMPRSVTATPEAFNTAQRDRPGPSAGPFLVSGVDRGAQRITLTRNPTWWGTPPRLDTLTYIVLADAARIAALRNNAIDASGVASLEELTAVRGSADLAVRRAPTGSWSHITFNGAPGALLADRGLRLAIGKAINRQAVADVLQRGLTDNPRPLNNHIYLAGQEGYQDNSAPATYDPEQAGRELDALGWRRNGDVREKDGRPLVMRNVLFDSESSAKIAQVVQNNLAQVGVRLQIELKPAGGFFSRYITVGDFDLATFGWGGDAFALGSLRQIYASDGPSNFGRVGSAEIDAKIEQTLSEPSAGAARVLANEVDALLWKEGFSLQLYQAAGNVAVRATLANYGAPGLADYDYSAIGFTR